jgi:hypothetical protein
LNYNNFTKDQKQAVWIILTLAIFAIASIVGAGLLASTHFIIGFFLLLSGLFLAAVAATGVYVEFIEKD